MLAVTANYNEASWQWTLYMGTICWLSQLTVMKQLTVNILLSWFVGQSDRNCKLLGTVGLK